MKKDRKRRRVVGKANDPKLVGDAEQPGGGEGVKSEPIDWSKTESQRDGSPNISESCAASPFFFSPSQLVVPPSTVKFLTDVQRNRDAGTVLKRGHANFGLLYFTLVADGAVPSGHLADFLNLEIPARRAAARRLNQSVSITERRR